MPDAWSEKDERQFEKIKQGSKDRGVPTPRAKEIAARTVNKTRRRQGRTPNKTTQGTGNPNVRLEERSKKELYNMAADMDIRGRSRMSKGDLVDAIRTRR